MNVALIPARGGSKRIPQKNIKYFNGFPIIYYAINNAITTAPIAGAALKNPNSTAPA